MLKKKRKRVRRRAIRKLKVVIIYVVPKRETHTQGVWMRKIALSILSIK